jgi:hypothetical protein
VDVINYPQRTMASAFLLIIAFPALYLPNNAPARGAVLYMQASATVLHCKTSTWGQSPREAAALASITKLEQGFTSSADEIKSQLYGMWKLLIADKADDLITQGMTGYGAPSHNTVLAHFQLFEATHPEDETRPTMQTVEVIENKCEGRSAIAALKGNFYVGKLAGSDAIGVVEDYTRIEYAGDSRYDSSIEPERWSCAFISPAMRVCRLEGGKTRVYARVDAKEAQIEIGRLLAQKVEAIKADEDGEQKDVEDDRPLWQKRLDEEDGRSRGKKGNRFDGPSITSDIP